MLKYVYVDYGITNIYINDILIGNIFDHHTHHSVEIISDIYEWHETIRFNNIDDAKNAVDKWYSTYNNKDIEYVQQQELEL